MDRQEEYEKVKSDSWGKCVLDGRLTKELVEEVFDTAYNLGKKHEKEELDEMIAEKYQQVVKSCEDFVENGDKFEVPLGNASYNTSVPDVRLQVATAAMQGMIGNWASRPVGEHYEEKKKSFARLCVDIADVLIAEVSKKGGEE